MQNTQPPIETTKPKKPRRLKKALLIIAAIIITPILLHYAGVEYSKWKMQTYLQDKYKKEFVVKNYRIEGAGLGVEGDPTADAYPKDNPDIKFKVWDYGRPVVGPHSYGDGYLSIVWGLEYLDMIKSNLQSVVSGKDSYEMIVGIQDGLRSSFDFNKGIPSVKPYLQHPDVGMILTVFDTDSKNSHKVWKIAEAVKSSGVRDIDLRLCMKRYEKCYMIENSELKRAENISDLEKVIKDKDVF